jgi:hypothetical protein
VSRNNLDWAGGSSCSRPVAAGTARARTEGYTLAKQDDTARRELRDLLAMLRDALGQPPLGTLLAAMAIGTLRMLAEQDLGKRMAMREQMKRLAMEGDRWDCGLSTALVVVLGATAAAAQAPVKEVIEVDDEFVDEALSEECEVEVTVNITGRVTIFTFPDGQILQNLTTLNLQVVFTASDNQIRTRDVGIDQTRVQPDGTVILSIVGQVPLGFTGVMKINLDTGEVILEPHHVVDIEEVCAQLTA